MASATYRSVVIQAGFFKKKGVFLQSLGDYIPQRIFYSLRDFLRIWWFFQEKPNYFCPSLYVLLLPWMEIVYALFSVTIHSSLLLPSLSSCLLGATWYVQEIASCLVKNQQCLKFVLCSQEKLFRGFCRYFQLPKISPSPNST